MLLEGLRLHLLLPPLLRSRLMLGTYFDQDAEIRVPWLSGACHLVPRAVWDTVGPLTEDTFCGFDDYDYCYRATRAHYEVWLCPSAVMTHHCSVAVRQRWASWNVEELAIHNTYVILSNHWPTWRVRAFMLAELVSWLVEGLRHSVWPRPDFDTVDEPYQLLCAPDPARSSPSPRPGEAAAALSAPATRGPAHRRCRRIAPRMDPATNQLDARRVHLSVVIPSYNRGPAILQTVTRVLQSEARGLDSVEVLVVDDGSSTSVERVAPRPAYCSLRTSLKVLRQRNAGPARARNLGFAASSGDIVLFLDDDVLVPPGLLLDHVRAHDQFPGSVICGRCPWKTPSRVGALFRLLGRLGHDAGDGRREDFLPITVVSSGQILRGASVIRR